MTNSIRTIYSKPTQNIIKTTANHLLVIIAFFLPISYDAVQSGFFILIIFFLFQEHPIQQIKNGLTNKIVLAFFLLWLLHIFGITYSNNTTVSSHYAKSMSYLLYPLLIVIFAESRFIPRILSAFIIGVFLSELLSYAFFFEILTSPIPQSFGGYALAGKDDPSPFTYHIEYGYILSITSAMILQLLLTKATRAEKILYTFFLTTITLNIFFNSARTGYVLFFISNGTILLVHYKNQLIKKLHLIIPFVLLVITIAWTSSNNLQREYHETLDSISAMSHGNFSSSLGTRVNFIRMGITTLMDSNPLIGFGSGMHGLAAYNQAYKENNTEIMNWLSSTGKGTGLILFTDCEYNSILLQFGFIGLLLYLYLFYQTTRFKQNNSNIRTIQIMILLSSLLYAIVQSLLFGLLVPYIFITLLTLTTIKDQPYVHHRTLSQTNLKTLFAYTLGAISLFVVCKVT